MIVFNFFNQRTFLHLKKKLLPDDDDEEDVAEGEV